MSKSQKKIANYALDHPRDITLCSASELGSRIGISHSTVIRFSIILGFFGYAEGLIVEKKDAFKTKQEMYADTFFPETLNCSLRKTGLNSYKKITS